MTHLRQAQAVRGNWRRGDCIALAAKQRGWNHLAWPGPAWPRRIQWFGFTFSTVSCAVPAGMITSSSDGCRGAAHAPWRTAVAKHLDTRWPRDDVTISIAWCWTRRALSRKTVRTACAPSQSAVRINRRHARKHSRRCPQRVVRYPSCEMLRTGAGRDEGAQIAAVGPEERVVVDLRDVRHRPGKMFESVER